MKHTISCYLLVLFAFSCKQDEPFDPSSYDGSYPRNDAIYSDYELDKSKMNWAMLRNYDPGSKVIEAEFDVRFKIDFRSSYSFIYPKHVTIRGRVKINI